MRKEDEYNYCYTHHIVHNKYSDCPDCTYKASQLKKHRDVMIALDEMEAQKTK